MDVEPSLESPWIQTLQTLNGHLDAGRLDEALALAKSGELGLENFAQTPRNSVVTACFTKCLKLLEACNQINNHPHAKKRAWKSPIKDQGIHTIYTLSEIVTDLFLPDFTRPPESSALTCCHRLFQAATPTHRKRFLECLLWHCQWPLYLLSTNAHAAVQGIENIEQLHRPSASSFFTLDPQAANKLNKAEQSMLLTVRIRSILKIKPLSFAYNFFTLTLMLSAPYKSNSMDDFIIQQLGMGLSTYGDILTIEPILAPIATLADKSADIRDIRAKLLHQVSCHIKIFTLFIQITQTKTISLDSIDKTLDPYILTDAPQISRLSPEVAFALERIMLEVPPNSPLLMNPDFGLVKIHATLIEQLSQGNVEASIKSLDIIQCIQKQSPQVLCILPATLLHTVKSVTHYFENTNTGIRITKAGRQILTTIFTFNARSLSEFISGLIDHCTRDAKNPMRPKSANILRQLLHQVRFEQLRPDTPSKAQLDQYLLTFSVQYGFPDIALIGVVCRTCANCPASPQAIAKLREKKEPTDTIMYIISSDLNALLVDLMLSKTSPITRASIQLTHFNTLVARLQAQQKAAIAFGLTPEETHTAQNIARLGASAIQFSQAITNLPHQYQCEYGLFCRKKELAYQFLRFFLTADVGKPLQEALAPLLDAGHAKLFFTIAYHDPFFGAIHAKTAHPTSADVPAEYWLDTSYQMAQFYNEMPTKLLDPTLCEKLPYADRYYRTLIAFLYLANHIAATDKHYQAGVSIAFNMLSELFDRYADTVFAQFTLEALQSFNYHQDLLGDDLSSRLRKVATLDLAQDHQLSVEEICAALEREFPNDAPPQQTQQPTHKKRRKKKSKKKPPKQQTTQNTTETTNRNQPAGATTPNISSGAHADAGTITQPDNTIPDILDPHITTVMSLLGKACRPEALPASDSGIDSMPEEATPIEKINAGAQRYLRQFIRRTDLFDEKPCEWLIAKKTVITVLQSHALDLEPPEADSMEPIENPDCRAHWNNPLASFTTGLWYLIEQFATETDEETAKHLLHLNQCLSDLCACFYQPLTKMPDILYQTYQNTVKILNAKLGEVWIQGSLPLFPEDAADLDVIVIAEQNPIQIKADLATRLEEQEPKSISIYPLYDQAVYCTAFRDSETAVEVDIRCLNQRPDNTTLREMACQYVLSTTSVIWFSNGLMQCPPEAARAIFGHKKHIVMSLLRQGISMLHQDFLPLAGLITKNIIKQFDRIQDDRIRLDNTLKLLAQNLQHVDICNPNMHPVITAALSYICSPRRFSDHGWRYAKFIVKHDLLRVVLDLDPSLFRESRVYFEQHFISAEETKRPQLTIHSFLALFMMGAWIHAHDRPALRASMVRMCQQLFPHYQGNSFFPLVFFDRIMTDKNPAFRLLKLSFSVQEGQLDTQDPICDILNTVLQLRKLCPASSHFQTAQVFQPATEAEGKSAYTDPLHCTR